MAESRTLIVGAGPTGLIMALCLEKLRVPFRIIEKNSGPGQASRAMAVQARTLEFYRQLGFADEVVRGGIKIDRLRLWRGGSEVAVFNLGDFGKGLSPYPFVLSFPQDDHERLLVEKLRAADVEVEWNTELLEFADAGDGVTAVLRNNGRDDESSRFNFICGCDGAHSAVREKLRLSFPGGMYEQKFFVADLAAVGNTVNGDVNFCIASNEFCVGFPIRSSGMLRLIGIVPQELSRRENLAFEDIRAHFEQLLGIRVTSVNWFSTYHVQHRVSDRFRTGRAFVAGDAGHLHSPAAGQGMNTGIGDAVNLSWKLAAILKGKADPSILDTYESERIAFARNLVSTTDLLFQGIVQRGITGEVVRTLVFPYVIPFVLGFSAARRAQFRLVSQTRINYRRSALSQGRAGSVHGGDRLPWLPADGGDNFAPLQALDWQIHVYGKAGAELREMAREGEFALHEFPWGDMAGRIGLERDALYLVRPDGHVAFADSRQNANELRDFLARFKIAPFRPASMNTPH